MENILQMGGDAVNVKILNATKLISGYNSTFNVYFSTIKKAFPTQNAKSVPLKDTARMSKNRQIYLHLDPSSSILARTTLTSVFVIIV